VRDGRKDRAKPSFRFIGKFARTKIRAGRQFTSKICDLLGQSRDVGFCLSIPVDEVAAGTIIADRPRTDPHGRALAHAAPILDEWRRSGPGARARDGAHEVEEAIARPA
jgi:hypothetical protein